MIKPQRLLIVERDASMTDMLQNYFMRQQVDVQAVPSVTDAQSWLAQRPAHVVLIDLFQPHNDGLDLLHYVRRVVPHTRVIVMGAFPSPEVREKMVNNGAYAFIEKPFRLEHLWGVVHEAFSLHLP